MTRDDDMSGKVCLVTGASDGIGKVTAAALARMGATTLLACRNPEKGARAAEEIGAQGPGKVDLFLADLSSQRAIRGLAEAVLGRYEALHVLVNNAGGIQSSRRLTEDGLESTFATNHLGYFLLTSLLLERLRRSAPARIVNVASTAHRFGSIDFDDLQFERRLFVPLRVYGSSKLANVLFTNELARRLAGSGVTANSLHPGTIGSNFGQTEPGVFKLLVKIAKPFMIGPERGARTSIYLASSPEVEGVTGQYFVRRKLATPSRASRDEVVAKRLWEVSERLTGLREDVAA